MIINVLEPAMELQYNNVGTKLLHIDDLPQGALARYERDIKAISCVIEKQHQKNQYWQEKFSKGPLNSVTVTSIGTIYEYGDPEMN